MGHGSSTLSVLDFATDFIPGVNLIKNTTLAIYDASQGDAEGAAKRAISMFSSTISTVTMGMGSEFVLLGEAAIEGTALEDIATQMPDIVRDFTLEQIGQAPITIATKSITYVTNKVVDVAEAKELSLKVVRNLHAREHVEVPIPEGGRYHWKRSPDAAMYYMADWSTKAEVISDCDIHTALQVAMKNGYKGFFFCWQQVDLNDKGFFKKGDAVFFTTDKPHLGGAPQCDYFQLQQVYN